MSFLNFSSYAKAIQKGMTKPTDIGVTRLLLDFIVDNENVLNSKGDPYNINGYYTNRWLYQHEDIPNPIKEATASTEIMSIATAYFESNVISKLSPQKEGDTYSMLEDLIKGDSDISDEIKSTLLSYYQSNDLARFLSETFLYAVQKNNKIQNTDEIIEGISVSVEIEIQKLNELLQRFPKPVILLPPDDLEEHEMVYVSELLDAYADNAGVSIISKDSLENYPKYKKNFDRQRKDYYAAETIRQSARDLFLDSKADEFTILKEETYDGIIDVCDDDYPDGYNRLNCVMKHATTIQLNKSLLSKLPGWISISEKKGICHLLVNDGEIKWVNYDE